MISYSRNLAAGVNPLLQRNSLTIFTKKSFSIIGQNLRRTYLTYLFQSCHFPLYLLISGVILFDARALVRVRDFHSFETR